MNELDAILESAAEVCCKLTASDPMEAYAWAAARADVREELTRHTGWSMVTEVADRWRIALAPYGITLRVTAVDGRRSDVVIKEGS